MAAFLSRFVIVLAMVALASPARSLEIAAPQGGAVRAVLIGVDLYRNVPPLRGAVADAEDLSLALRAVGARDVTLLTDGAASRDAVLKSISDMTGRTGPGDLVILSVAGHGSSEPERVKGSKPSGRDEVYVLAGFDTRLPGSGQRIFGDEFKAMIRQIEARGADILFIADSCFSGGLTRSVDPRDATMTWRNMPAYTLDQDDLAPISATADALSGSFDFKRLTFVAAVDDKSKSPEVSIPGVPTKRGALSYAMARALQGAADRDGDGKVSRRELFEYLRQTVYQLTEQRQNIVTEAAPGTDMSRSLVYDYASADAGAGAGAAGGRPLPSPAREDTPQPAALALAALTDNHVLETIRPALTPFRLADAAHADLVFDASRSEALSGGDVVATGVGPADMPFVVDRMAARERLKALSEPAPQTIRITPDDRRHRQGEQVGVAIPDLEGRRLMLFDVSGDGTVQFLYPDGQDSETPPPGPFALELAVVPPFGTDMLVAVSASSSLDALKQFLRDNDHRRSAGAVATQMAALLPPDARVGFSVLYTAGSQP